MPFFSDMLGVFGASFTIGSRSLAAGIRSLIFRSGAFTATLRWTPTASRTITLPDATGTVLLDTTIGAATARILVHARQNTEIVSSGVAVLIPFSTEIVDSQNLFTNGNFTPTSTAVYRISVNVTMPSSGWSPQKIIVYQGTTRIAGIYEGDSNLGGACSGFADLQLTSGLAYHIKGSNVSSFLVGAGIVNTLTIEKIT